MKEIASAFKKIYCFFSGLSHEVKAFSLYSDIFFFIWIFRFCAFYVWISLLSKLYVYEREERRGGLIYLSCMMRSRRENTKVFAATQM